MDFAPIAKERPNKSETGKLTIVKIDPGSANNRAVYHTRGAVGGGVDAATGSASGAAVFRTLSPPSHNRLMSQRAMSVPVALEALNAKRRSDTLSLHTKTAIYMALWYACSGCTLFGNKYILSSLHADPNQLAMSQMVSTAFFGALKMYGPYITGMGPAQTSPLATQPWRKFAFDMAIVGIMRFFTVMLGLVSLKYVAVSFTETVKASAPFFTVLFARLILKEYTSAMVNVSLLPVVGGLALCSATELSYTSLGFFAAVANNCIDCIQNVFSKKLLSTHYNFVNLQFYTSAAALAVQLPLMLYINSGLFFGAGGAGGAEEDSLSLELLVALFVNGIFFHLQSVLAYAVMGLISPVTQSVANTVKRGLLIWLSILYFRNPVTGYSALGTAICVSGVFAYNYARRHYPYRPPLEGGLETLPMYRPVPTAEPRLAT